MKTATAKDLRYKTSSILANIRKGNEVVITFRGKSVAVLMPLEKVEREFNLVGFAIWKDRKDLKKPDEWVEEKRKERFPR